jgi:penicillin V acylase-like amidase (Ntn superfamily)
MRELMVGTLAATIALTSAPVLCCTRILSNDKGGPVVSSRSMDWPESTHPHLWVFPAGLSRDGAKFLTTTVVHENPERWTSRYGSVVTTAYDVGTVDGLNSKGFGVHLLYLNATDFGPRDPRLKGIQAGLWGQYLLDNAATVTQALELMTEIQPVMVEIHGHKANLHLAMQDASGDSAIIEFVKGKPLIHHGRQYRVMTNDPPFDEQLDYLKQFDFNNATRQTMLPGNVDPKHRFVRATYFEHMLPKPQTERAAIAGVLSVARVVSVPFGAPNNLPGSLYNTEYRTAQDMTNLRYVFELSDQPNTVWMDLANFDLSPGAPVKRLDPSDMSLAGDVSGRFTPSKAPF